MVSLDTIAYNPAGSEYNKALISGGHTTGARTPTNAPGAWFYRLRVRLPP